MKKIISLSLALICLLASVLSLASCANNQDRGSNEEVTPTLEHLQNLDFGGIDVNFAVASADGDSYHRRSIDVDYDGELGDENTNSVDVAIYQRNLKIETMLNVNIEIAAERDGKMVNWGKVALLSGTDDYDVIAGLQYGDVQLALEGVILDLNTLADYNADYIKWDREYWASSYINELTFGNKVFWLTGDLCLRFTGGYYCFFVNSNLYNSLLAPEYGSIYDIVNNKKWTYGLLAEMVQKSYQDDGNDKVDVENDRLGLALPTHDNTNGMAIGAGVVYTRYDEDGNPQNNFRDTNKTLIRYMESLSNLATTKGAYVFGGDYQKAMSVFSSGKAVFVAGRLNQAEMYLSEMNDDYYVIPCPMLDEDQGAYYSSVHDAINVYGINYNSSNIDAAAATLEAMAYESYYEIRPIYYDSFLKFKYTRDDEAAAMIDLMHDTIYTDFVYIWQFSGDMNSLGSFLRQNATNKNAASAIKRYLTTWDTALEKILASIKEL